MINLLVETKNEYTTQLVNVLAPLIFEGIQSIYKESLKVSNPSDILKNFQSLLRTIPTWNNNTIKTESERIMNNTRSFSWLGDLIRATLKANIVVLMYNPNTKKQSIIDPKFYNDIKIEDFIHKVYIETARDLWNNPYLLYHNYPPIELKRNQRDTINIIKDCIRESIRKLLPVKHILTVYLGDEYDVDDKNEDFEKSISDVASKNLSKIVSKDLSNDNINKLEFKQSTPQSDTIRSKILDIIQDKNFDSPLTIGEYNSPMRVKDITNHSQTKNDSIKHDSIKNTIKHDNLDKKIESILKNDLDTEDVETSLNKDNSKVVEMFSNSNDSALNDATSPIHAQGGGNLSASNTSSFNPSVKRSEKNKRKFFNNFIPLVEPNK